MRPGTLFVGVSAGLIACTGPAPEAPEAPGAASLPIVDGVVDRGSPAVIFLYNLAGSACTGSIIAPRVVLTAKHCVRGVGSSAAPASRFRVYVGSSVRALTAEYLVDEVRPAPGCWNLCGDSTDVAVLILSRPAPEAPLPVSFDDPGRLIAQQITAIGFGETPSGSGGVKYRTRKRVTDVRGGLIVVEPAVCSGDSGGPLIGPDGAIHGVASFIFSPDGGGRPTCGTAPGVYNAIAGQRTLIETAIEDSGTCVPHGEEVCDGADNDCNGEVDEGCIALGQPCTRSDECVGNQCVETPVGRICTRECDPLRPALGCGPGLYCASAGGCDGLCALLPEPATPGAGPQGIGQPCAADTECASLYCNDPGDGVSRCLTPCRGDTGTCLSGEACAALPGGCGGCVNAEILAEMRGLGEPCEDDAVCRSGRCFTDEGIRYCSRDCSDDDGCPSGFHCRGADACVRGPRGDVGSRCVTGDDCADGVLCASRGDLRWCTTFCRPSAPCPDGFECVAAGDAMACAPAAGLVGQDCVEGSDCVSGLCLDSPAGRTCSRFCGSETPCESGLECLHTDDGLHAVCVPHPSPPPPDGGGCAVAPVDSGRRPASFPLLAALCVLAALGSRRRP